MKLVKVQAGQYATPDGRYLVEQQEYERECECAACSSDSGNPCPGRAVDWFWHIWDVEQDDYLEGTHFSSFETLREAREHLGGGRP